MDSDGSFPGLKAQLINKEIDTVIVFRRDKTVWDYYAKGWNPERLHVIHSCTKSIVSLLIGTLLDRGLIENTEVPVYTLFPELQPSALKEENKALKLKDFLTMSTGLRSRDSYVYRWEGIRKIWNSKDWVKHILTLEVEVPGGERFDYSNLSSFLLAEIIRSKTGKDVSVYAEEMLFNPLGIDEYYWKTNPKGQSLGWSGLYLKPSDLMKIGQLVLQKGEWLGVQLVSSSWIEESVKQQIKAGALQEYYGYQWWIDKDGRILALGYGGQYLIIDPGAMMVTVFTARLEEKDFFLPYNLYMEFIVP